MSRTPPHFHVERHPIPVLVYGEDVQEDLTDKIARAPLSMEALYASGMMQFVIIFAPYLPFLVLVGAVLLSTPEH